MVLRALTMEIAKRKPPPQGGGSNAGNSEVQPTHGGYLGRWKVRDSEAQAPLQS